MKTAITHRHRISIDVDNDKRRVNGYIVNGTWKRETPEIYIIHTHTLNMNVAHHTHVGNGTSKYNHNH